MKATATVYTTLAEYESAHNYVIVEAPENRATGQKVGPAGIFKSFRSRKSAENSGISGRLMTRKQAERFIKQWNAEYENGPITYDQVERLIAPIVSREKYSNKIARAQNEYVDYDTFMANLAERASTPESVKALAVSEYNNIK